MEEGADIAIEAPAEDEQRKGSLFRRVVAAVTIAGLGWRILMLASKWNRGLDLNDSLYYSAQAYGNAHGEWYRRPFSSLPSAEHPPLTSLVLTPASLLSNPVAWQRVTMTLLGTALIPLIAIVGRRLGGRRLGVIAAVVAAVYANIWVSDSLVMSETLSLVLVTLAIWAAICHQDRFDIASALVCGLAVGLAGNARSEVLLFAPLFALIGMRSRPFRQWLSRAAVIVFASALAVVPWVAYNLSRFDSAVYMSTNDGTTLLGANCPLTYGGYEVGGWSLNCLVIPPDSATIDPVVLSSQWRHLAVDYAFAHKSRWPIVVGARLLRTADLYGLDSLVRLDVGEERPRAAIWAGIVSWWILAPFAVAGWWRMRRRYGYVLAVPVINVIVVAVVFYGAHRLRAPMEPVVVLCSAAAIAAIPAVRRGIDRWLMGRVDDDPAAEADDGDVSPATPASLA